MLPAMTKTTPVIDDPDGQIVLIPAEFAFSGETVRVRREGGAVVLEALESDAKAKHPEAARYRAL